ncbi:MAG TPA: autotransporter-associated beta strand repeat-containing protein [Verrucomicrobiae bacterium]
MAEALIVGPYSPDANTLHLWHFNELSMPVIDYAPSGGTNLTYLIGGATLGNPAYSTNSPFPVSFTNSVSFGTLTTSNAVIFPIGSGNVGTPIPFTYAGAGGAFTYEAVVLVQFNPTNNYSISPVRNQPFQIMNCDGEGTATRVLQFRIDPIGFAAGGRNTNVCGIEFIDGTTTVAVAPIPTNGPDAIVSNQWYHVAVTYNGTPNTTSNLLFYWTLLDPSRTAADCIYGTNMTSNLPGTSSATTTLSIGNSARNPGGGTGADVANFLGQIDEIRISGIARSAEQMMFVPPAITFTTQPANQTVVTNQTATFTALAGGVGTLTYHWYFLNTAGSNAIPNATNTSLSVTAGSTAGVSNYFVVAVNGGINPPATSSIAGLTIRIPLNLEWAGTGSSWDTSGLNWTANGNVSQTEYTEADNATFDNLGAAQSTINLAQTVHPTSVTVNGSASYTLTGTGSVGGYGTLSMNDSGTLLLDTTNNTYSGGTLVSSGTLQIGDGTITSGLGSGPVTNNSAILAMPGTVTEIMSNAISGSGTLTESGSGNLILTASNSYSGHTTITSGTLHVQNASALGLSTAPLINTGGGNLYVDANVNLLNPLTLGGNNVSLEKGGGGVSALGGAITLASSTTLSVDGGATLDLTNASGLNGASASASLTLAGAGTGNISGPLSLSSGTLTVNGGAWTIAPINNHTGLTTISGGSLFITGPLSLGPVPGSFTGNDVTLNGGTLGAATNVILDDGNIGIQLTASSEISAPTNVTFTISNQISSTSGAYVLEKTGPGTVILAGANPFNGTLDVDSASTTANDGMLVIANNGAIANIPAVGGLPFIFFGDNNGGSSTLGLNGSNGSITIAPDISLTGRNVFIPAIENLVGNNTVSGNITLAVGGGFYIFQSDAGTLALTAPLPYATPTSSTRTFTFQGTGAISMSGAIQDGSNNGVSNIWINVIENGPGLLNLSAANTYSGFTSVSNGVLSLTGSLNSLAGVTVAGGLLVGGGSINGAVTVNAGGAIEAGTTNSIGTLTLGNTLALSGNTIVKINASPASDLFSGQTGVTYGGTLTVANLAGTPALGNSFTLFNPGASTSNFSGIIGSPGAGLAYSFTNGVLTVVKGPAFNSTNITFSAANNILTLSWPADHLGWILQTQTNSLKTGLSNNWVNVSGSGSITRTNITINPSDPTAFFRLESP